MEKFYLEKPSMKRKNDIMEYINELVEYNSETGVITLSFQRKYLLFGTNTAQSIGHHIPQNLSIYNNGVMSEEDYQKLVTYNSKFAYNQTPQYKSFKK